MTSIVLGIETSCDETAAAVVDEEGRVLASRLSSQTDVHARFGGVVPELAARRHIESIEGIVAGTLAQAGLSWEQIGAIAVTQGPGLAGALLVGVSFAKGLAYARRIPLIPVNHLEAHIASAWLDRPDFPKDCVVLVVSGGHTHLYQSTHGHGYCLLGRTLDDAAGEAFDKAAKMLGLPYPGGPEIDRLARSGHAAAIRFPRATLRDHGLDFSFSGLKTALLYYLKKLDRTGAARPIADLAASFQEAIVDVLVEKAFAAVRQSGVRALAVVGGVSANSRLRARLQARAETEQVQVVLPPFRYCTDNAAMVALAGRQAYGRGLVGSWDTEASANLPLTGDEVRAPRRPRGPRASTRRIYSNRPRIHERT
jgi:N6-L-threonylcarbamoyladenine synthase